MDEGRLIIERRITQRVGGYWERIAAGRPMPVESDIDPDALGDDWKHCFLLQTRDIDHIEQFNFTYLGESIVASYETAGIDPDNLYMIGPKAFCMARQFLSVVKSRQPLVEEGGFIASNGNKIIFRQVLLPLGSGKQVEGIFGAMLFKLDITTEDRAISKSIW